MFETIAVVSSVIVIVIIEILFNIQKSKCQLALCNFVENAYQSFLSTFWHLLANFLFAWSAKTIDIVYIYLDTKLAFEFIQILKPFKNEAIAVEGKIYISEVDIIQEKAFNLRFSENGLMST